MNCPRPVICVIINCFNPACGKEIHEWHIKFLRWGDTVGSPGLEYIQRRAARPPARAGRGLRPASTARTRTSWAARRGSSTPSSTRGRTASPLGNHTWTRWELQPYLNDEPRVVRPANFAPQCPGPRLRRFRHAGGAARCREPPGPLHARPEHGQPLPHGGRRAGGAGREDDPRRLPTPRPRARRRPWATISTAASVPSGARTRTCRPPTRHILPRGHGLHPPTSAMTGPAESVHRHKARAEHRQGSSATSRAATSAPGAPSSSRGALFYPRREYGAAAPRSRR